MENVGAARHGVYRRRPESFAAILGRLDNHRLREGF
jgi:hypothetical protein